MVSNKLGRGSYGKVIAEKNGRARKTFKGFHYAVREYANVSILDHPNIIKFEEWNHSMITSNWIANPYVRMKIYDCSLDQWLNNNNRDGTINNCHMKVIISVLRALEHMHSNGVLHADIKPANILLDLHKKSKRIKSVVVSDLGISSVAKYALTNCTSPLYQDSLTTKTPAHDIYSFGMTILVMIAKYASRYPKNINTQEKNILRRENIEVYKTQTLKLVPYPLNEMVSLMIADNPSDRPTASRCLTMLDAATKHKRILHEKLFIENFYNDEYSYILNYFRSSSDWDTGRVERGRLCSYALYDYLNRNSDVFKLGSRSLIIKLFCDACTYISDCLFNIRQAGNYDLDPVLPQVASLLCDKTFLLKMMTPSSMVV